ncbi:MAG: hypothetical protein U9O53_05695 [archaeon]|nr:hypothetical protein [archaeon]
MSEKKYYGLCGETNIQKTLAYRIEIDPITSLNDTYTQIVPKIENELNSKADISVGSSSSYRWIIAVTPKSAGKHDPDYLENCINTIKGQHPQWENHLKVVQKKDRAHKYP